MISERLMLLILDGWGIAKNPKVSAIDHAKKPFFDSLDARYINAQLNTTGLAVGLPDGQMGNSEVGHMNIGAGRIVYQMLVLIGEEIKNGALDKKKAILDIADYLKANPNARLHLMGLDSDGGIHAHIDHLIALLHIYGPLFGKRTFIHAFTDGRDSDPHSGKGFIAKTIDAAKPYGIKLASIIGRYYSMDRDHRWERVKLAYDALVHGQGEQSADPLAAMQASYDTGTTDEFIKPIVVTENGAPVATFQPGDAVLFFNFRTDRGRQLTHVLTQAAEGDLKPIPLHFTTMTRYEEDFKDVQVVYEKDNLINTLGETIAKAGKHQIRIAETEKYPHVTFFFNGGREEPFPGEERILCPSPKVATYDLKPEMSAYDLTNAIIPRLEAKDATLIVLNYANADMVGHTGVWDAAIKAVETVDDCLSQVVPVALANGYACWVIADHGNSDVEVNADGTPNTQHSTNPVPSILVAPAFEKGQGYMLADGKLGDVGPTILKILGIDPPAEMTGDILLG